MATNPYPLGPISSVLESNGFMFDKICTICGNKPTYVKIVGGRTCEIKIKGVVTNPPTGMVFTESSATINFKGQLWTISSPQYTQSVLTSQGLAKEITQPAA